ncbi:MAG: DUF3368 domain-containing protein [Planctomycetota bacterium]|jgi:predicted nucleic acid-binding protein
MKIIISDTGPLIAFARTGTLSILQSLFDTVLIPPAVHCELALDSEREGVQALRAALEEGWLDVHGDRLTPPPRIANLLDRGEAEAIALALQGGQLLLIDERMGRRVAETEGLRIVGTAALLVTAKRRGFLPSVRVALAQMRDSGYRLSPALCRKVIKLAGE